MTYRCRGGLNGRGGIIRGPPREPLFQRQEDYDSFIQDDNALDLLNVGQIHNRVEQLSPQSQSTPLQPSQSTTLESPITPITNAASNAATNATTNVATTAATNVVMVTSTTSTVIATNSTDGTCMTITDERGNPSKVDKELHPKGDLWFTKQKVVKKVTGTSFKQFMDKPYTSWSKKEFSWDPSIDKLVKAKWKSKLNRRLTNVVSKLVNQANYRPKWCPLSMKAALEKARDNSPFKKKSQQCSINRKNSSKGLSKHCQGSVSTEELKDKMTIENGGQKHKNHRRFTRELILGKIGPLLMENLKHFGFSEYFATKTSSQQR